MMKTLLLAAILFLGAAPCWSAATDFGFNFRATAGFVTDQSYASAVLGETYIHTYTNALSGTIVAGWETGGNCGSGPQIRDRSAAVDARLAGINFMGGSTHFQCSFRVDLPAIGLWSIVLASGDQLNAQTQTISFMDNGVAFATYTAVATPANNYMDANGTVLTNANWISSNVPLRHLFTSTLFEVLVGASTTDANSYCMTHLRVSLVTSGSMGGTAGLGGKAGLGYWQPIWRRREQLQ